MDNCPQPKTTAARRLSPFAVNRVAKNFFIELFLITIRLKPLDFCCFLHHPLASGTGKVQPRR
ncbi:hypothetical protein [Klebsiella pneumoniae IS43]|uniref:Uncharacterized protein n=1 Tax=Klebsiella pneumoniae IS43 TaxID=1432552 RepID=W1DK37_KLEPN|nr:hypothetical protein [Klebsiella pneumoniae IS43]